MFITRELLADRVRTALLQLGERESAAGREAAAANHAEAAYLLRGAPEPDPEDLERLHALLRSGGSPYAAKVRASAESYGIALADPRETPPSEGHAVHHNLLTRPTSFVGRDPERLEVASLLSRPDCRLVTVHGPGGVGKSRLALQAAHDLAANGSFQGGVFLVPLDALTAPELIPGGIVEALGLETRGREDVLELVGRAIGEQATLLLFDNVEHLMGGVPLFSRLLASCPKLKLLITSREQLNLEEEWVLTLEGLPLPPDGTSHLEEAWSYGAVRLFLDRARRARLDVSLSDDDLPPLLEICRLVGGAPLGIELAAVWVKALPVAEIAEELAGNLGFLETSTRNLPDRHHSIQAAFEHSWKLLTSREQTVLRQLSVFVGGFRREAAAEVAGATLAQLAALADKSLLRVSAQGRYDRHPLIDQFARDKLAERPEELQQVREQHARYYLDLVQRHHHELGSRQRKEALTVFDEERGNIRSAWSWAIAGGEVATLGHYAAALSELYQKHHLEGEEVFARAAAALDDESTPDRQTALGHVLIAQADQLYGLGRDDQASDLSVRALELLRPLNDDLGVMRGVMRLGQLARRSGDLAQAKAYLREGLELARKLQLARDIARFSSALARLEIEQGHSPDSERYCRQVLAQLRELGQPDILIGHLTNFGWLYLFHDVDWQAAKPLFEEGWQLAQAFDFPIALAPLLDGLARIAREEGDLDRARALLQEGLELSRRNRDSYAETFLTLTLATVALAEGAYHQAQALLLTCLQSVQHHRHGKLLFRNLTILADLSARQGDAGQALTWLSLVRHHATVPERDKVAAQRLLAELRSDVPTQVFFSAVERGKGLDLDEVVAGLLERSPASGETVGEVRGKP